MSGGGGGVIIIHSLAQQVAEPDRSRLQEIADRSVTGCSVVDAVAVLRIVWKLIRRP